MTDWIGTSEFGETVTLENLVQDCDLVLDHISLEKLYHGRCVRCLCPTRVVHELEPKSRGRNWERWSNRVTLCHMCHDWAHSVGTRSSRADLLIFRDLRLKQYHNIVELNGN